MSQTFWKTRHYGAIQLNPNYGALRLNRHYGEPAAANTGGLAALVIPVAIIGVIYFAFVAKPMTKKTTNRRNGTKKGQRRKTARRAYKPNRRGSARAKKAMNLYHSGEASSLKAAWRMV